MLNEVQLIEPYGHADSVEVPLPETLPPAPIIDAHYICERIKTIYHSRNLSHEAVRDIAALVNDITNFKIPKDPRFIIIIIKKIMWLLFDF